MADDTLEPVSNAEGQYQHLYRHCSQRVSDSSTPWHPFTNYTSFICYLLCSTLQLSQKSYNELRDGLLHPEFNVKDMPTWSAMKSQTKHLPLLKEVHCTVKDKKGNHAVFPHFDLLELLQREMANPEVSTQLHHQPEFSNVVHECWQAERWLHHPLYRLEFVTHDDTTYYVGDVVIVQRDGGLNSVVRIECLALYDSQMSFKGNWFWTKSEWQVYCMQTSQQKLNILQIGDIADGELVEDTVLSDIIPVDAIGSKCTIYYESHQDYLQNGHNTDMVYFCEKKALYNSVCVT